MMIINTNAWHYKVIAKDFFMIRSWYPSKSLCLYFWQVVFRLLMALGLGLLMASPLVFLMSLVSGLKTGFVGILGMFGFIVTLLYTVPLAGSLCVLIDEQRVKLVRKYKQRYPSAEPEYPRPKEPNIFWEYAKAKRAKVCPVLTFEAKGE